MLKFIIYFILQAQDRSDLRYLCFTVDRPKQYGTVKKRVCENQKIQNRKSKIKKNEKVKNDGDFQTSFLAMPMHEMEVACRCKSTCWR